MKQEDIAQYYYWTYEPTTGNWHRWISRVKTFDDSRVLEDVYSAGMRYCVKDDFYGTYVNDPERITINNVSRVLRSYNKDEKLNIYLPVLYDRYRTYRDLLNFDSIRKPCFAITRYFGKPTSRNLKLAKEGVDRLDEHITLRLSKLRSETWHHEFEDERIAKKLNNSLFNRLFNKDKHIAYSFEFHRAKAKWFGMKILAEEINLIRKYIDLCEKHGPDNVDFEILYKYINTTEEGGSNVI